MKVHGSAMVAMSLLFALSSGIGCVAPVGTIVAFAGTVATREDVPKGWLLCDGKKVPDGRKYDELRKLLRRAGWGKEEAVVLVPDLRGMFLRGVDDPDGPGGRDAAGNDKDSDKRQDRITKLPSTLVGSVQDYATARPRDNFTANLEHHHGYNRAVKGHVMAGGKEEPLNNDGHRETDPALSKTQVTTQGGGDNETRPKNAYVNFIIKY